MNFGDPRLPQRFWDKVSPEPNSGCWLWFGSMTKNGYGVLGVAGQRRNVLAHRLAFETLVDPIPDGLEIDHLCRVRCCVNPVHLEAVTHQINLSRGERARRTHCPHGHEYTPENTLRYARGRTCRTCNRERSEITNAARRSA